MNYYVYMLTNKTNKVLYTGVTNDLLRRVYVHKNNLLPKSFTAKYNIHKLVYYETTTDAYSAISREKQIKGWTRAKKNELINSFNPQWNDLYDSLF
ncbi:MAG: GIY-YIG nuclease family protein [Clostridia bacterium]|nr:GIY-YIG nuclease family protein [Clostridia bacterium]